MDDDARFDELAAIAALQLQREQGSFGLSTDEVSWILRRYADIWEEDFSFLRSTSDCMDAALLIGEQNVACAYRIAAESTDSIDPSRICDVLDSFTDSAHLTCLHRFRVVKEKERLIIQY